MTNHWVDIAVFAAGVIIGALLKWGYLRINGWRVRVPYIDKSDASIGIAVSVVTVLSLVTIVQGQVNQDRAEDCNRQFREALQYNTDVNSEQRQLNEEARNISVQRREIQDKLFLDLGDALPDPVRIRELVGEYNKTSATYGAQYDALVDHAKDLNAKRKPYPTPECGQ